ncbi:VIT domain-containing protein [Rhodobacteraceae bacterium]|nr:VIT domain-containing protein [Paracoccaceae bacterium]
MQAAAFGHQIDNLHEGLTVFHEGSGRFIPMQSTNIAIEITSGVATVQTQRVFRNSEDVAIEAVLTMPVGFDAVVTGLSATVDDRRLVAIAKTQSAARNDYEGAIDRGKMAILHEEVLKGVHTLSVAQLAPANGIYTRDTVIQVFHKIHTKVLLLQGVHYPSHQRRNKF